MSKSIAITLPNDVADTLNRYMLALNGHLPDGMLVSRSSYVAKSVKATLEAEGVEVVRDDPNYKRKGKPLPSIPPPHKLPPL
jgi:hypothetical protein